MDAIPSQLFALFIEQGIEKGLLKKVTKTLNEQQYLHYEYIDDTILKLIDSAGKITVEELAESLRLEHADVAASIKRASPDLQQWTIIEDLVFTKKYIEKIKETIMKQIAQKGYVSVITQAQENKLPYALIKSLIDSLNNEKYIRYSQLKDIMFTKEFIRSIKSAMINSLKLIDEPTPVSRLQKQHQTAPEDLFYLILEQIVKEDEPSLGLLRGKRNRAIFEPEEYKERQVLLIKSVFDSNECISYKSIEELYPFTDPIDFMKENYNEKACMFLNSCVVKTEVKDRAKATIEITDSFYAVNELFPTDFTVDDTNKMIDIIMDEIRTNDSKEKPSELLVLDNGYVVAAEYVEKLVSESRSYLRDLSRSVRQRTHKQQKEDSRLKNTDIVKAFENAGCPNSVAKGLIPHTQKQMVSYYNELLKTPYFETKEILSNDEWINTHKRLLIKKLTNIRQCIYYNYKALSLFTDDGSAHKSLEKYLLKNQCTDFLFHFVIYSVVSQSFSKDEVAGSSSLCIQPENIENEDIVDTKQQKNVISHFLEADDHKYDKSMVTEIEGLLKKKDLSQFITIIIGRDGQQLFENNDILGSEEDKAGANEMIQSQLQNQLQQVSTISPSTAPQLLHLVSLIIFQYLFKMPLYVSGKFVPAILKVIMEKSSLSNEEDGRLLNAAHTSIMNNDVANHIECFQRLKQRAITYR
ncbi:hypothetical protein BDF20DRAFT_317481 [Mycotypha africana]|uniref:uncharacterized protein n=1 Tax=Mycotypha africana TaxID=64632 RepID=UPI002301DB03|nr:uncharacterized protein BDF20DRAFT_317481 [Mycotypha africana]KAI8988285.1 hypothetical protein BDF20DRAFT_317481 [Mycotypha africana]